MPDIEVTEQDRADWERLRVPVTITFCEAIITSATAALGKAEELGEVHDIGVAEGQIVVAEAVLRHLKDAEE